MAAIKIIDQILFLCNYFWAFDDAILFATFAQFMTDFQPK